MHPALTASSENSLRSAFAQFLAAASENKERCLDIRPKQRVRDSDRLGSRGFRDAIKSRRCLIPADGFYEWSRTGTVQQPFCFEVGEGELFAFAGLWERWRNPTGDWIRSCSILPTTPNAITSQVHDRMPVILNKADYDLWMDPGFTNVAALSHMLKPYDASKMRSYPVSNRNNQVFK